MFDFKMFTKELAELISGELTIKAPQFKNETIVGLALDCHPWHPVLELCLLTNSERDKKAVQEWGRWSLADWKYFQFSRTETGNDWVAAEHLIKQMNGRVLFVMIFGTIPIYWTRRIEKIAMLLL